MSEDIREIRLAKLACMRSLGHDPYAIEKFESTGTANQLLESFVEGKEVQFAGRVVSYRLMGKAGFLHLSDGDNKLQVYCRKDELGELGWALYDLLDIGDHLGVAGHLFVTKTGEKSIHATTLTPLSKCLQALPLGKEKDGHHWYGLADVELRYRHRHLDLVANHEARQMLINRSKIVSATRRYFDQAGYLEVETPLLQVIAGGAAARPFNTHFNAYELDVKLRISLELYLKRLICGDIPAVYEIGRVFRNEGVSNRHNPEFTLLEFYESYVNLEDMMRRVEEMFAFVATEVFGSPVVQPPSSDITFDFTKPWARVELLPELERLTGLSEADFDSLEKAKSAIRANGVEAKANALGGHIDLVKEDNLGGLIEKLLEIFIEPTLIQPTFVIGYPIETSPLAKKSPTNPKITRRFEGYILGREICNAFSEINDPIDQRERFEQQAAELSKGDEEAHPFDEEFIFALEGGMPPTGGCGIGMERLAMVMTGADHIREIMLFPMMKPKEPHTDLPDDPVASS